MDDPLIEDYRTWLRSWGAAERTVEARTTLATSRLREWGIDGFTPENVTAFLARPTIGKWTRATYHSHLTCFCAWLAANDRIPASPMPELRKPKRPASRPRPLSEDEVARVLGAVQGEARDWIMLALLAGLRAHEIAKISGDDVEEDGIYVDGKGESIATLPCHPDLWEMAQRYPRHGYWFPGNEHGHIRGQQISLTIGRLFHSMGITGSIHRCRHVYATRLLRSGLHVRKVQQMMRHANLDTTANYTAVDEAELRSAILVLPSIAHPPTKEAS